MATKNAMATKKKASSVKKELADKVKGGMAGSAV